LDGLLRDGLAGEATAAVAVVEDGLERGGGVGHGNSGSLEGVSARVSHAGALASEPGRRLRYARGMAVRVDAWTWSVRLFRSRTKAAAACRGGHVKINGETAQPSKTVVPGDRVQVTGAPGRTRILEVVETVSKRVGAPVAATCYVDRSPPPPPAEMLASQPRRARGAGRPTKRERRELDRLHGRRGAPAAGERTGPSRCRDGHHQPVAGPICRA